MGGGRGEREAFVSLKRTNREISPIKHILSWSLLFVRLYYSKYLTTVADCSFLIIARK